MPKIELPETIEHPCVAVTPKELARLRAAWKDPEHPGHRVVSAMVKRAETSIAGKLTFPPRGGQHNQWYQCEACQRALETVDPTHHKCPTCGKVYTGEPYDDVIFARIHNRNLKRMDEAAWAFAITGDDRFGDFAREVLTGYAQRYRTYPYHGNHPDNKAWTAISGGHLFEQTLNESAVMTRQIAPAYDLVYNHLTPEQRKTIEWGLIKPMVVNFSKYKAGKSNWQSWHNAGMIWAGAVLHDEAWIRKALADKGNGFARQMEVSVLEDGMWYENSWGYHFYTLSALTETAEAARRLGIDIWHHPVLKSMYLLPTQFTMPGGRLPRFGDDVNSTAVRSYPMVQAYHVLQDEALRVVIPARVTFESVMLGVDVKDNKGKRPTLKSALYPSTGHAILRSPAGKGLAAAITFGPYGGSHGHFDKLSYVLYGHGRELGVDPGRKASQAYRLPIHRQWYKATLGHNAVVVDRKDQKGVSGRLVSFASRGEWSICLAECNTAYPGVKHRRLLVLGPSWLAVVDQLGSKKKHRYDWAYHNKGKQARCSVADEPLGADRQYQGLQYIKDMNAGEAREGGVVFFADDKVTTRLTFDGSVTTRVMTGHGPLASVEDRVPLAMLTRRGTDVVFACAIEPMKAGTLTEPEVHEVTWHRQGDDLHVKVGRGTVITLGKTGAVTVTHKGEVVLDAQPEKKRKD